MPARERSTPSTDWRADCGNNVCVQYSLLSKVVRYPTRQLSEKTNPSEHDFLPYAESIATGTQSLFRASPIAWGSRDLSGRQAPVYDQGLTGGPSRFFACKISSRIGNFLRFAQSP